MPLGNLCNNAITSSMPSLCLSLCLYGDSKRKDHLTNLLMMKKEQSFPLQI
ncbi:hypothetical protein AB205_0101400 [Aquarana catesbeiana]|uniref:Uncharacterized protein n=1 Tax=Aquarana catesbeiana TaxID=8400 RepID=A0A2G9Q692_AQUCT|nr:hypothetical protein AB205_0101400 [Aquarana catesbeiana]